LAIPLPILQGIHHWECRRVRTYNLLQMQTICISKTLTYTSLSFRKLIHLSCHYSISQLRNKYRQRNVFLYPPQDTDICDTLTTTKVVGDGTCGVHGNTKIFEADQAATKCDGGNIEGPFISVVPTYTYTTLIGKDNAVLYQVYMPAGFYPFGFVNITLPEDRIFQSQLTTITKSMDGSQVYRTRTAQGFDAFGFGGTAGVSNYASYYRERKVTKEEFYEEFENAKAAYNIRDEDLCKWDGNNNDALGEGVDGSMAACEAHLEESFELL